MVSLQNECCVYVSRQLIHAYRGIRNAKQFYECYDIFAYSENVAHTLHVDGTLRLRKILPLQSYVSDLGIGARSRTVRLINERALIKRDRDKIFAVEWA